MTIRDWNASLRPKVQATRNLHELLTKDINFFICLSSVAGIIGSRGQANYNAGTLSTFFFFFFFFDCLLPPLDAYMV